MLLRGHDGRSKCSVKRHRQARRGRIGTLEQPSGAWQWSEKVQERRSREHWRRHRREAGEVLVTGTMRMSRGVEGGEGLRPPPCGRSSIEACWGRTCTRRTYGPLRPPANDPRLVITASDRRRGPGCLDRPGGVTIRQWQGSRGALGLAVGRARVLSGRRERDVRRSQPTRGPQLSSGAPPTRRPRPALRVPVRCGPRSGAR